MDNQVNLEKEQYVPEYRADVDRRETTKPQQRPRKFKDKRKLRKKNSQGIFEYDVTVASAEYDKATHTWMYTLDDYDGKRIVGQTKEIDLTS